MKITEIEYGHWNAPSWKENIRAKNAQKIGEFDGYEIYNQDDYYFIPNAKMSYLGFVRVEDGGYFKELYVPEANRRRGYASSIILFLIRELNIPLILNSDEIVTDDSRQVFYSLATAGKISIAKNNEQVSLDQLANIFKDVSDNDDCLIIESKKGKASKTCYELVNPSTGFAGSPKIIIGESVRQEMWFD